MPKLGDNIFIAYVGTCVGGLFKQNWADLHVVKNLSFVRRHC